MGQDATTDANQTPSNQAASTHSTSTHGALQWLASERRSWQEVTDAWRANPAASVFEDLARWTCRSFARSMAMFVQEQQNSASGLRAVLDEVGTPEAVESSRNLEVLSEEAIRLAAMLGSFDGDDSILTSEELTSFETLLQSVQRMGNDVLIPQGFDSIDRPSRRFYPNGMMRRPWLKADWRPCLFPARADLERAGEFWPILDFMSEHERRSILAKLDSLIEGLCDRSHWAKDSPIRTLLDEHKLPSTDACVQFVKDQLFARGMDWRPDPPPIPPPVD